METFFLLGSIKVHVVRDEIEVGSYEKTANV